MTTEMTEMIGSVEQWLDWLAGLVPQLLIVALILLLSLFVARHVDKVIIKALHRFHLPTDVSGVLGGTARVGILLLGCFLVLDQLGLSRAVLSFIASLGIAGIIIGFALQDILKQFAAGVLLLIGQPFHTGDRVQIGTFEGVIMQVQLRVTILKTDSGDEVLIPNADVYSTAVINKSRFPLKRYEVTIHAPTTTTFPPLQRNLQQLVEAVPGVSSDPAPVVYSNGIEDKGLAIVLRLWVDQHVYDSSQVVGEVLLRAQQSIAQRS